MRLVTSITHLDLNEVGAAAKRVEAAGIDGVSTQENKHDPYLPLAIAATNTRRLGLRTSIAIAFSRSPMPVANIAWDLQTASQGRFTLGLESREIHERLSVSQTGMLGDSFDHDRPACSRQIVAHAIDHAQFRTLDRFVRIASAVRTHQLVLFAVNDERG